MKPIVSEIRIPSRLEYLEPATAFTRELATISGFDHSDAGKIQLAVEEALANAMKHGLEMNPDETITIQFELSGADFTIRIREKGVPFDPDKAPKYSPDSPLDSPKGLGAFLMNAVMDEVVHHNLGRHGKELLLTKRLKGKRIDEIFSVNEMTAFVDEPQTQPAPAFTIRRLEPDEAIEVSKCAYRAYGYTYDEYIYFPEKIVDYNRRSLMLSAVAVTEDGRLMGHEALKYPYENAPIAEIGAAFVKPKFRKLGLFQKLSEFLIAEGSKTGLKGLFGRTATSHVVSQRMSENFGFRDCGIFLGMEPAETERKNLTGKVRQRETLICSFFTQDKKKRTLFPPMQHRSMIEKIYTDLGIAFEFGTDSANKPSSNLDEKVMMIAKGAIQGVAEIFIKNFDGGAFESLRESLHNLVEENNEVIYLYLNLEDKRCGEFCEQCEKIGFFFSGILPAGALGADALLMTYFNNVELDYDLIRPYSKAAREILGYILENQPKKASPS